MSTKNRKKFSVAGQHPLLSLIRDRLIHKGLVLVSWDQDPDFCVIGAEISNLEDPSFAQIDLQIMQTQNIPVILLSSDSVYPNSIRQVAEEDAYLSSQLLGKPQLNKPLYALTSEQRFLQREAQTLVLRIFNVYGPSINWGVVHEFRQRVLRHEPMIITPSQYYTRSFLHESDFFGFFDRVLTLFFNNLKGVYNIGALEEITLGNLAKSISRFTRPLEEPNIVEQYSTEFVRPYKVPCVHKVQKAANWKPKMTIRKGLFEWDLDKKIERRKQ